VTDVSGRGVGLDAVAARVRALGGALDMQMRPGEGTTFTMRLPITLAVAQALRVRVGDEDYAIPLTHVSEAIELDTVVVEFQDGREVVHLRDEVLPLIRMRNVLRPPAAGREAAAVVAELGERRTALAVDHLVGREQILVKQFDAAVGTLPIFSGVTLLADGRPALVLDPVSVA
jgi:two-component system chemotaxis sensor kinase CheA